jgi:hypothetical protein
LHEQHEGQFHCVAEIRGSFCGYLGRHLVGAGCEDLRFYPDAAKIKAS